MSNADVDDTSIHLFPEATQEQRDALGAVVRKFRGIFKPMVLPLHVVQPPGSLPSSASMIDFGIMLGRAAEQDNRSSLVMQIMKERIAPREGVPAFQIPLTPLERWEL